MITFYNAAQYIDATKKTMTLTDTQEAFLYGLFFGYAVAVDQTTLTEAVCTKLTQSYLKMKDFLETA